MRRHQVVHKNQTERLADLVDFAERQIKGEFMIAEKFLLLLEMLLSCVVDDKPPTVTSTPAAYP